MAKHSPKSKAPAKPIAKSARWIENGGMAEYNTECMLSQGEIKKGAYTYIAHLNKISKEKAKTLFSLGIVSLEGIGRDNILPQMHDKISAINSTCHFKDLADKAVKKGIPAYFVLEDSRHYAVVALIPEARKTGGIHRISVEYYNPKVKVDQGLAESSELMRDQQKLISVGKSFAAAALKYITEMGFKLARNDFVDGSVDQQIGQNCGLAAIMNIASSVRKEAIFQPNNEQEKLQQNNEVAQIIFASQLEAFLNDHSPPTSTPSSGFTTPYESDDEGGSSAAAGIARPPEPAENYYFNDTDTATIPVTETAASVPAPKPAEPASVASTPARAEEEVAAPDTASAAQEVLSSLAIDTLQQWAKEAGLLPEPNAASHTPAAKPAESVQAAQAAKATAAVPLAAPVKAASPIKAQISEPLSLSAADAAAKPSNASSDTSGGEFLSRPSASDPSHSSGAAGATADPGKGIISSLGDFVAAVSFDGFATRQVRSNEQQQYITKEMWASDRQDFVPPTEWHLYEGGNHDRHPTKAVHAAPAVRGIDMARASATTTAPKPPEPVQAAQAAQAKAAVPLAAPVKAASSLAVQEIVYSPIPNTGGGDCAVLATIDALKTIKHDSVKGHVTAPEMRQKMCTAMRHFIELENLGSFNKISPELVIDCYKNIFGQDGYKTFVSIAVHYAQHKLASPDNRAQTNINTIEFTEELYIMSGWEDARLLSLAHEIYNSLGTFSVTPGAVIQDHGFRDNFTPQQYYNYASSPGVWLNNSEIAAYLLTQGFIFGERGIPYGYGTRIECNNVINPDQSIYLYCNAIDDSAAASLSRGTHWVAMERNVLEYTPASSAAQRVGSESNSALSKQAPEAAAAIKTGVQTSAAKVAPATDKIKEVKAPAASAAVPTAVPKPAAPASATQAVAQIPVAKEAPAADKVKEAKAPAASATVPTAVPKPAAVTAASKTVVPTPAATIATPAHEVKEEAKTPSASAAASDSLHKYPWYKIGPMPSWDLERTFSRDILMNSAKLGPALISTFFKDNDGNHSIRLEVINSGTQVNLLSNLYNDRPDGPELHVVSVVPKDSVHIGSFVRSNGKNIFTQPLYSYSIQSDIDKQIMSIRGGSGAWMARVDEDKAMALNVKDYNYTILKHKSQRSYKLLEHKKGGNLKHCGSYIVIDENRHLIEPQGVSCGPEMSKDGKAFSIYGEFYYKDGENGLCSIHTLNYSISFSNFHCVDLNPVAIAGIEGLSKISILLKSVPVVESVWSKNDTVGVMLLTKAKPQGQYIAKEPTPPPPFSSAAFARNNYTVDKLREHEKDTVYIRDVFDQLQLPYSDAPMELMGSNSHTSIDSHAGYNPLSCVLL